MCTSDPHAKNAVFLPPTLERSTYFPSEIVGGLNSIIGAMFTISGSTAHKSQIQSSAPNFDMEARTLIFIWFPCLAGCLSSVRVIIAINGCHAMLERPCVVPQKHQTSDWRFFATQILFYTLMSHEQAICLQNSTCPSAKSTWSAWKCKGTPWIRRTNSRSNLIRIVSYAFLLLEIDTTHVRCLI